MYTLTIKHFTSTIEKGDTVNTFNIIKSKGVKTKKEGNKCIEEEVSKYSKLYPKALVKKSKSIEGEYTILFTGNHFTNENNGETYDEYYMFIIEKIK